MTSNCKELSLLKRLKLIKHTYVTAELPWILPISRYSNSGLFILYWIRYLKQKVVKVPDGIRRAGHESPLKDLLVLHSANCISRHNYKSKLPIWSLGLCSSCNLPLAHVFILGGIAPLSIHGAAGLTPVAWDEWTRSITAGRDGIPPVLGGLPAVRAGLLTSLFIFMGHHWCTDLPLLICPLPVLSPFCGLVSSSFHPIL